MSNSGSITGWFHALGTGQSEAAERLWKQYFDEMTRVARSRIGQHKWGAFDEEDVALSAFNIFCVAVQAGKYESVGDRFDLWNLLMTITVRKASDHVDRETAQKRGCGQVQQLDVDLDAESWLQSGTAVSDPELIALMREQCQQLIESLADSEWQTVALLRLQGYTIEEIATEIGRSRRTVNRTIALIRRKWTERPGDEPLPA